MREPDAILVTGATGYVGSQLVDELLDARPRGAHPQPPRRGRRATRARATCSPGQGLPEALEGVDTAYYLVHSMGSGGDFAAKDRQAAVNFAEAAADAGVKRVVYLGGLGSEDSEHLRSRHEVAQLLRARLGDRLVYVRAAMIIGPGSASYDILEHLIQRLPVMIVPALAGHEDAADRALGRRSRALADLAEREDAPDEVQLGGSEVLTYREMMRRAAPLMGRRPPLVIRVPVLTPRLSSYWVALVTPVSYGLIKPLVDGLGAEMVVERDAAARASTTSRWASRTRSGQRCEAAQPPGRAPDRQRGDRRPRGAHGDGPRRRGALDPGGERRHARGRAARAVEAGQPRAARAHLLEVPLARDARDHPRHLHRGGARGRGDRPPARAAALPRARVRASPTAAGSCSGGSRTACSCPSATRATWRSTSGGWSPTARATRACTSRSRWRTSIPRSSTFIARWVYVNTQSRIHVLVTHGFLRSLARLELEESAVGRFSDEAASSGAVNVGDTPWQGVAVLTLLAGALVSSLRLRRARRAKKGWRRWS